MPADCLRIRGCACARAFGTVAPGHRSQSVTASLAGRPPAAHELVKLSLYADDRWGCVRSARCFGSKQLNILE